MDGYYAPAPAALMNQLSPQMPVQSYIHQAMSSSPIMQPLLQQPSALPSCAQPLLANTAQQHQQQQQQSPLQSPLSSIPSNNFLPLTATKRRQNNGTMSAASTSSTVSDAPPDGKPKRGRPRKVKKEEKLVSFDSFF
ncbi:unnamed protein product [Anisakis simplex]|uniref:Uncharacterized protein n=1 Tax=Anisakis simplex TaxID=6269 RepID=A0A0M3JDJ2_ANISI|nr:unnamed protein product [Anisakis simplex]